jgi:hypothetical protein
MVQAARELIEWWGRAAAQLESIRAGMCRLAEADRPGSVVARMFCHDALSEVEDAIDNAACIVAAGQPLPLQDEPDSVETIRNRLAD